MLIRLSHLGAGLSALALFLDAGVALAQPKDSPEHVQITIDAGQPGPKIDRHIFGQFAEHLGQGIYEGVWVGPDSKIPNTRGVRNDVVAALKAIKVPVVRWPGGCFADNYHWREGIGPASQRRARLNADWGGVLEPNTFGVHEFMDFAEQVGAEAYISANVATGSPQEAADWLEYMTATQPTALAKERQANGRPAPFKVAFWGIGNEAWGCGGAMSSEHYLEALKTYARFSRNYDASQKMQRIAVGPDGDKTEYTETIMKAWKDRVWSWDLEGLSLHWYTVNGWPPKMKATGFGEAEYAALIKDTLGMDALIQKHSAIMDRYDPDKKVSLVVDEWGAWLAQDPGTPKGSLRQQNSQRDAVLAALNLNIFARHADRVRMTNIAQMVNVLQAMILTDHEKMVLTPTYHVYKLYTPFQDATFVPVRFEAGLYASGDLRLPRLDAIAARDVNGKLWLAITNIDPTRPAIIDLAAAGLKARTAVGQTLTAPRVDAVNTFAAPDMVTPKAISAKAVGDHLVLEVPRQSVTVVALEP